MRVLCPVVDPLVPPVFDARHDLALGCGVTLEFIGHHHPRCPALSFHQLAQQSFSRFLVPPALHQDIEHEAISIHRAPEVMVLAGDGEDDLVEMPLVAPARFTATQVVGDVPTEFQAPLADRFVADRNATGHQHLFNHPQAQREAKIQPNGRRDDFAGVAVAG